jgi:hypothetical protein
MDIENYLKPLSNNERAVLFAAAGLQTTFYGMKWIQRTQDLWDDLATYARKRTKVSSSQVDKAIESLVAKGYVTIEPKRGNYVFWNRRFEQWRPHNGTVTTKAAIFRKKQAGGLLGIDWVEVADVFPVEDVKGLVLAYRENKKREEMEERIVSADRVALRQKEIESKMLRLCELYASTFRDNSPISESEDEQYRSYMPYQVDDLVGEIASASKELEQWTYTRRDIERDAQRAREEMKA